MGPNPSFLPQAMSIATPPAVANLSVLAEK
jgi:hypothetical protein